MANKKLSMSDLYYNVQSNYNMAIRTGKQAFMNQAKESYKLYKARKGKRKFPTQYK